MEQSHKQSTPIQEEQAEFQNSTVSWVNGMPDLSLHVYAHGASYGTRQPKADPPRTSKTVWW